MNRIKALSFFFATMLAATAMAQAPQGEATCKTETDCISGTVKVPGSIPDTGKEYQLTGKGMFPNIGHMDLTGSLYSLGFISSGKAGGTVVLKDADGSIEAYMEGPEQPGFSPLPKTMQYTLQHGTQRYARITGKGTVDLQVSYEQTQRKSLMDAISGTFALTFHPAP